MQTGLAACFASSLTSPGPGPKHLTPALLFPSLPRCSLEYVVRYNHSVPKYQWCRGGPPELVPQLRQLLLARSDKQRPARGLTLVTQLSVERFSMLENQCRNWPHAISATLYVPTVGGRVFSAEDKAWHKQPLDAAIAAVSQRQGDARQGSSSRGCKRVWCRSPQRAKEQPALRCC